MFVHLPSSGLWERGLLFSVYAVVGDFLGAMSANTLMGIWKRPAAWFPCQSQLHLQALGYSLMSPFCRRRDGGDASLEGPPCASLRERSRGNISPWLSARPAEFLMVGSWEKQEAGRPALPRRAACSSPTQTAPTELFLTAVGW